MENLDHFLAVMDKLNLNAFLDACNKGDLENVRKMYENYNLSIANIEDAMFNAVDFDHLNILEFLFSKFPKNPKAIANLIVHSAREGNLDALEFLHQNGGDIHYNENEAFIEACTNGRLLITKYLHENGTDIAVNNNQGLQKAAKDNRLDVVKYLIENGANIESKNNNIVKISARKGFIEQLEYLLEHGGSKDIAEKYGNREVQAWLLDQELSTENKQKVKQNKL